MRPLQFEADGITPKEPALFAVSISPMDEFGKLDDEAFRAHLRRLISAGIGIYVASSAAGEGQSLTRSELEHLCGVAADECASQTPVYLSVPESRTTTEMLEKCRIGLAAGADVIQLYQLDQGGGHGIRASLSEQEAYFRELLEAIDAPVVLSLSAASGFVAPATLTARLCNEYPQVRAVAVHGPNLIVPYFMHLRDAAPSHVKIYGSVSDLFTLLPLGGWGCVSAHANIIPNLCRSMVEHFVAGRITEAGEAFMQVQRLSAEVDALKLESGDALKGTMRALGLPSGYSRPPRQRLSEESVESVRRRFEQLDWLRLENGA
jgi:4-hydroxy-tetrahydrodipicolinate synthase